MASLVNAAPETNSAKKSSPRRTSNVSQTSSRQSFASEYSYHESEGETPLKPCYDEADALAAALKESEQEEAFDRIAKQMEAAKIAEEGEAEEEEANEPSDVASEAGSDAEIPSRAALAAVQNLSAPTPTKTSNGKKATCLHGNGPECGSCAEIFAAPPSPLN